MSTRTRWPLVDEADTVTSMKSPTLKELLTDPEQLQQLLSRVLPDESVNREDVERRLALFSHLEDPRFRMDATSDLVREQLTDELKEKLALQEAQLGRHTLYSITARHHRVEPYETDWRGKQCQSVRVTLPEKKGARDKIWTRLGVVKSGDHLLFSAQEVVERYEAAFGRTPRVGRVDQRQATDRRRVRGRAEDAAAEARELRQVS